MLGGFSQSGKNGDKMQNNVGEDDYWIVKLDSSHNIQWQRTIGGTRRSVVYCASNI